MQKEITEKMPLFDADGNLNCTGFARSLLLQYRKPVSLKDKLTTKEWDYYYVGNSHFGLALTIDDNGYMGLDSVSFLDFDNVWEITRSVIQVMTLGRKNLPVSSVSGNVSSQGAKHALHFENAGTSRHLSGYMKQFRNDEAIEFDIVLTDEPQESMVIVTPFEKPGRWYYNQKINCMKASGTITIGRNRYELDDESYGTLDWGRGRWTYSNTWYWSSLSCSVDGAPFGFNLGYGFGDTSAATENMLFYQGKTHKLENVEFHIPQKDGKDNFTGTWTFTSSDGRAELTFEPVIDRYAYTGAVVIESDQHQVFGRFSGYCILDDGTRITLDRKLGFAEKVRNKW